MLSLVSKQENSILKFCRQFVMAPCYELIYPNRECFIAFFRFFPHFQGDVESLNNGRVGANV